MSHARRASLALATALAIVAAAITPAHAATGPTISTVAGTGVAGFSGDLGLATQAEINVPRGVATASDGGFYISDLGNSRIRRVWPNQTITTIAGTGVAGFSGDGGPATSATINFMHDVAETPSGGVAISDTKNQRIRYVDPAGVITTVAGSGPYGSTSVGGFKGDGGPATSARLNNPHGIDVGSDGSILIADTDNQRVRLVDPNGTITTVAGSGPTGYSNGAYAGDGGPATSARLKRPFDVAFMPGGGFLIADTGNAVIRRVWPNGTITTVAGIPKTPGFSGDGGPATSAKLRGPDGVAVWSNGAYAIADNNNQRVRWVSTGGTIRTRAGTGTAGYNGDGRLAATAQLNSPESVAIYPNGSTLVADEANNRIRLVTSP